MRLFYKIAALLIIAAAVPLGTVGFELVRRNERAVEDEVRARFHQTAQHAAEAVATDVEGRARLLVQIAPMIPWAKLAAEEAKGALQLLRRQARADLAALVDEQGATVTADPDDLEGGRAQLAELMAHAPLDRARKEGQSAVVFSMPFRQGATAALVAALSVNSARSLVLLIPLSGEAARLDEIRGAATLELTLTNDQGDKILSTGPAVDPRRPAVSESASVGSLGWGVVASEEKERAFGAARALRRMTLLWTCGAALAALGLAFLFARRLTHALERLTSVARALGAGALDARVEVGSEDEVGELGETFNQMGAELKKSRTEIEGWNRELEARVELRTRELKEAQAQLVQAQKLAALGQLGAGAAHEINNPLGGVIGHVELLLTGRSADHPDYEALRCVEEGAKRAAQVVQNLLRFSVQHHETVRAPVDANRLVKDTLSLTLTLLAEQSIEVNFALADPAPRLSADAGQIGQVLLNLVANARTAMPKGGRLTVASQSLGSEVALTVEDTGKGIAPEIRDRIFDPFFTTKDDWSNVGLGLSTSYRIVSEHGGRIIVDSELGRGAKFTVYLPAT